MPNGDNGRGGYWGGTGSRVISHETIISEIWTPLLAGVLLVALALLCLSLFVFDSLMLGPWLWVAFVALGMLAGAINTIRTEERWSVIISVIAATIALLAFWFWRGPDWLFAIWPAAGFANWLYRWPAWYKVIFQPVVLAGWAASYIVGVRLAVEIFDPGWSRRFERDAAIVGVRALWPLWGEQFPAQAFDKRIEEMQAQLEEAQVSTRRVQLEITNGQTIKRADLPDDPAALDFYRAVAHGDTFSTQTAIKCKCRAAFQNEIRPIFIDRGWAYWVDEDRPKAGTKLRAEGWKAICKLCT